MPARTWRTSSPMSTRSFRSLSAPWMRSADFTMPARSSTLAKSSMLIFADAAGAAVAPVTAAIIGAVGAESALGVGCALPGLRISFSIVSILSSISFLSARGKTPSGFPIRVPGFRPPHCKSLMLTFSIFPDWPSCSQIFCVASGITGCARTATIRSDLRGVVKNSLDSWKLLRGIA